jgi:hypothetical protein
VGAFSLLLYRPGLGLRVLVLDDLDNMLAQHKPSVVRPETETVRPRYVASQSTIHATL